MLDLNFAPFVCVLVMIAVDIVSGIIKAGATGTISSAVMRSGLWHKSAVILLEVVAFCCALVPVYVPGLPEELASVYFAISAYIVLMELVSVLENLSVANPDLASSKILSLFGVNKKE